MSFLSELFPDCIIMQCVKIYRCTLANTFPLLGKNALTVLYYLKEMWRNNPIVQPLTLATETTQCSIGLLPGSKACFNKPWDWPLTLKLRQNTSYLQLGEMNNRIYAVMKIFAQRFNICSPKFGCTTPPFASNWLHAWQQWLLVAGWFSLFCCNWKLIDSSRWSRKDKFGMVNEIGNRQQNAWLIGWIILLKSHKSEQKSNLQVQIFYFSAGDCGAGGNSWFESVIGWFSPVFAGLDRSRSIVRSTALGVVLNLVGGLRSSIQWIGKWIYRGDYSAWVWRYWLWIWGNQPVCSRFYWTV